MKHFTQAFASCVLLAIALGSTFAQAAPQLPDFTYQGQLQQNGQPANGNFDFTFALFNDPAAGAQIGSTITENAFPVGGGLFTVSLAFPGAFAGTQLWLQVTVNGAPMLPRTEVSTVPVAQYALAGSVSPSGPAGGALTGNYPSPFLATGSVTANAIATSAVGTTALANTSVTRQKLAGGNNSGLIGLTLGGNQCADAVIGVTGAAVGDLPFFSVRGNGGLPTYLLILPLQVDTVNQVKIRVCNLSATSQTVSNLPINVTTIR